MKYLISQDSKRPLQSAGGAILRSSGKTLSIVSDLRLQRVDVGNDLFGSDNIAGNVDDGLRAGERTAAESRASGTMWHLTHQHWNVSFNHFLLSQSFCMHMPVFSIQNRCLCQKEEQEWETLSSFHWDPEIFWFHKKCVTPQHEARSPTGPWLNRTFRVVGTEHVKSFLQ